MVWARHTTCTQTRRELALTGAALGLRGVRPLPGGDLSARRLARHQLPSQPLSNPGSARHSPAQGGSSTAPPTCKGSFDALSLPGSGFVQATSTRFPPLPSSPLLPFDFFPSPSPNPIPNQTTHPRVPTQGLGTGTDRCEASRLSARHMSNWSAALELSGLDTDSAFQETILAQFRESYDRMVRAYA